MRNTEAAPVAIVGAGWAGLACAVTLTEAGRSVQVFEAARQPGGRARRLNFADHPVDNGQHLLLGAYRDTLALLRQIGVDPEQALLRQPLQLRALARDGRRVELKAPRYVPAPLHLLWALATARGLGRRDRWRAMQFGMKLQRGRLDIEPDRSVTRLLQENDQPAGLCEALWFPLCLAIMNTPPEQASAAVFVRVLADAFLHHARDADLLYARRDLGRLLPDPALEFLDHHGSQVRLGQRITGLTFTPDRIDGVRHAAGTERAPHVVLALPPFAAARLCESRPQLAPLVRQLQRFDYEPICTVYLQYPPEVRLPLPMLGLNGAVGQWVFDRRVSGQPGVLAVVISSRGPHLALDNAALIATVSTELARHFPAWPAPTASQVVREKRATFACTVDSSAWRPANATALPGLWLAGDFTATGYPATLEGAVRSGVQCARQILAQPA
jgi:squalene-associated FAD-dependent desaturase